MNTNPDEARLAMWLDDELQGADLAAFESWLESSPDAGSYRQLREDARRWKQWVASAVPATEEPPFAEFFNHRLESSIVGGRSAPAPAAGRVFSWRRLFMPVAACAGMVLAFWLGERSHPPYPEIDVAGAPKAIPVDPILYTPESGVVAEFISGSDSKPSVIVLNGVDAIPDDTDLTADVEEPAGDDAPAMAGVEEPDSGGRVR